MKPMLKHIYCFSLLLLMTSACGITTVIPQAETIAPIPETLTPAPQPESTNTPSPVPTNTPIPSPTINQTALNFGEPILQAIQGTRPVFEDDFSADKGWEATTAGIQDQLLPLSLDGGFIQTLGDGGREYTHIVNPYVGGIQDFAMIVDAAFMGNHASNYRNRTIGLCWWPGDNWGETFLLYASGKFEGGTCTPKGPCPAFTGRIEPIPVEKFVSLTLIHRKGESVVYVDGVPLAYHKLSIADAKGGGFSLCPHTFDGEQSDIKYDNVQVWNLN